MVKFQKREKYPLRPQETNVVEPMEAPEIKAIEEPTGAGPQEKTPDYICGINNCTTFYKNPILMAKHKERVHGIPAPKNLNQPKPRNENIKLA